MTIIQKKSEKEEDEDKQLLKKATDGWTAELMNRPNLLPSPSSSFLLDPFSTEEFFLKKDLQGMI